jgi:hypothetical protein
VLECTRKRTSLLRIDGQAVCGTLLLARGDAKEAVALTACDGGGARPPLRGRLPLPLTSMPDGVRFEMCWQSCAWLAIAGKRTFMRR